MMTTDSAAAIWGQIIWDFTGRVIGCEEYSIRAV